MGFFRIPIHFFLGVFIGILQIACIGVLPFPFSQFPLFPILIALALVNRSRATFFWVLFVAIFISDLYSATFFGVGIFSFVFIVVFGVRLSSDVVTHRSLVGCLVISFFVGAAWAIATTVLPMTLEWWRFKTGFNATPLFIFGIFVRAFVCAIFSGMLYVLTPRWFINRSPVIIGTRHL